MEQVNAASASSTSSSHAVIESDDTSNSSDSSEGEDFDHEENQRTCTVGKRLWVTDVSLDGRDPRPMEDIASLPPSMPGFVTSRNQEVDHFNYFFPSQLVTWMVECKNANFRSYQKHTDQVEMEKKIWSGVSNDYKSSHMY